MACVLGLAAADRRTATPDVLAGCATGAAPPESTPELRLRVIGCADARFLADVGKPR